MRSILIFLVVVVLALGGYWVLKPEAPQTTRPGTGGTNIPAPANQRPQIGGGPGAQAGGPSVTAAPEGLEARLEAGVFSWRDTVNDDYLIPMESAWTVDLSAVDLEADVLCVIDGVEITRDELHSWVALKYGHAVINSRLYSLFGRQAAEETGMPYGLTDAEWDRYFDDWIEEKGVARDQALAFLAVKLRVPMDAVEDVRREMVQAVLACFPPVETVDELPLGIGELFVTEDKMKQAASLGTLMRDLIVQTGRKGDGAYGAPISGLVDPMSMLFMEVGSELRFRRVWSNLEGELPEGALVGYFTGELDPGAVLPPWEHAGDRELITIAEVWDLVSPGLSETKLRADLRELVWSKLCRAKLAQAGTLPSQGANWRTFAEEYLAHSVTFFQLPLVIDFRGYPERSFYIDDLAISNGIFASQPEGWMDEDQLRDFFENNRFFLLGWEPNIEVALFMPRDPTAGSEVEADWDKAKADAEAFLAQVEAGGDFTSMRLEHNQAILAAFRSIDDSVADAFAKEFGTGEFQQTMQTVNQVLKQKVYREHIDAVSPLRNAVIRLEEGEISPPWRTPVGYVLIRMNGARLGTLEREYEDVIDMTTFEHGQWVLRKWVTENLSDLEVVIPTG